MSRHFDEMKKGVLRASEAAIAKKKRVLERLMKKRERLSEVCLVT